MDTRRKSLSGARNRPRSQDDGTFICKPYVEFTEEAIQGEALNTMQLRITLEKIYHFERISLVLNK